MLKQYLEQWAQKVARYEGALLRIRDYPDEMESAKMKRKFIAEDALQGKGDVEDLINRADRLEEELGETRFAVDTAEDARDEERERADRLEAQNLTLAGELADVKMERDNLKEKAYELKAKIHRLSHLHAQVTVRDWAKDAKVGKQTLLAQEFVKGEIWEEISAEYDATVDEIFDALRAHIDAQQEKIEQLEKDKERFQDFTNYIHAYQGKHVWSEYLDWCKSEAIDNAKGEE